MFAKKNRLAKNRDFLKVFKNSRPVYTEHLAFRVAKRIPTREITNNGTKLQNYKSQSLRDNSESYQKEIATPSTMRMAPACRQARRNDKNELTNQRVNQSTGANAPRFGIVVSNKIDKRSSRRNGLKRRIRAIIQGRLAELSNGCDVIIQVKKPFEYPYKYNTIEEEILFGLKKCGLI